MKISFKEGLYGAFLIAATAGSIYSGVKLYKNIEQEGEKALKEKYIYQPKIDSIKEEVKKEVSQADFKKFTQQIDRPNTFKEKAAAWEHVIDSIKVNKLGQEAINEFKAVTAEMNYKKAAQAVTDTIKIIK